jgi:hypothetical protein
MAQNDTGNSPEDMASVNRIWGCESRHVCTSAISAAGAAVDKASGRCVLPCQADCRISVRRTWPQAVGQSLCQCATLSDIYHTWLCRTRHQQNPQRVQSASRCYRHDDNQRCDDSQNEQQQGRIVTGTWAGGGLGRADSAAGALLAPGHT